MTHPSPDSQKTSFYLDKLGRLFESGEEITHQKTLNFFFENIKPATDGNGFVIQYKLEVAPLKIEDTPLFVERIFWEDSQNPRVQLKGNLEIPLNLKSLRFQEPDRLTCEVFRKYDSGKESLLEARFLSAPYHELLLKTEKDKWGVFLPIEGEKFYLNPTQVGWKKFWKSQTQKETVYII